jgi:hypothetical protein
METNSIRPRFSPPLFELGISAPSVSRFSQPSASLRFSLAAPTPQSSIRFTYFLIEANPVNLDPRFATDSQSQRLDGLLFNGSSRAMRK